MARAHSRPILGASCQPEHFIPSAQTGEQKLLKCIFHSSGDWEVQDQGACLTRFCEYPLLDLQAGPSPVSSPGGDGVVGKPSPLAGKPALMVSISLRGH